MKSFTARKPRSSVRNPESRMNSWAAAPATQNVASVANAMLCLSRTDSWVTSATLQPGWMPMLRSRASRARRLRTTTG